MTDEIKVVEITEHEDGSALVMLEMDPEIYSKVFNIGFIQLVKKGIESEEGKYNE